ncbi:bifunctional Filamin-ABP280 repeat-like/Immunoglobulin-like fold/Immunoglobulin E-set [Babesia duncani]|uniref:Bifunctional Filamin-ABP280 repeat-like/Immunoglobulin-like fold/Immunoglobulin E-set n=1 Tax=Babesia duncani TaxID=323732 RepID=A0AAD9PJ38_9APIC|nr:bifunctional Filamin-ABP280 repeat-like/Immunoglobulin-like fold/Immunoglobulin E-set [Babesia duncani]
MAECTIVIPQGNKTTDTQFEESVVPLPQSSYAEGSGLQGGRCGDWLTFYIHKKKSFNQGVVRLHLNGNDTFNSCVFFGEQGEQNHLERQITSNSSIRLMYNSNISRNDYFKWDSCYIDDNKFRVRYRVQRKGQFRLHVKLDGNEIPGSPFDIFISDGITNALHSRVIGKGVKQCSAIPMVNRLKKLILKEPKDAMSTIAKDQLIESLDKVGLINKIRVYMCDDSSQPVTCGLPYVNAWGQNYAKVIKLRELGKGTVEVLYVVFVPSDAMNALVSLNEKPQISVQSSMMMDNIPCSIFIEINGIGVYGSPFTPSIDNVVELKQYFDQAETLIQKLKKKFSSLLQHGDFEQCIQMYNMHKTLKNSEGIINEFTNVISAKIHELVNESFEVASSSTNLRFISKHNLGRLYEIVEKQYQKMFKYKTTSIVECIRELNNSRTSENNRDGFNNLGDVILNYRRIGDELRKLHRFELAKKFDAANDQLCEEAELGRWEEIIKHKENKVQNMKATMDEYSEKLARFKSEIDSKYSKIPNVDIDAFKKKFTFKIDKSQQTLDEELFTSRMKGLLETRCTNTAGNNKIDTIVNRYWRNCNIYDIQSSFTKVLKSSVRLKNSLYEMFLYYSGVKQDSEAPVGITKASMHIFIIDARVNDLLCQNPKKIDWLFDKFSCVVRDNAKVPVIPQHLWFAFIRELAYLNLLYTIAQSGNLDLLRDSIHPSRLVAFHHFCDVYLVPLYERLYLEREDFQKCLKWPSKSLNPNPTTDIKVQPHQKLQHLFASQSQLTDFIKNNVPQLIISKLSLDVLRMIFKHYSRIAMHAKEQPELYWDKKSCWISRSTLIVFAKDFNIVPGYIDADKLIEIAAHVTRNVRLLYKDFVDVLVNTLACSVAAICYQKQLLYQQSDIHKDNRSNLQCIQSHESVNNDVTELLSSLGITDMMHVSTTIESIYGAQFINDIKT